MENLYLKYREGFPTDLQRPFLESTDGSFITYGELEEQASQYSNGFADLG